ncbi:MAG: dephospho-CoA kinase [Verrucomicrobiaceae bacterium]|jgi:dephospho-CoA kinase|nr:dephospho-CoA kinase [Verrucomicrobiaceae bacterium]
MKSWIVTGGPGCGKSTVSRWLGELAAPHTVCFSADDAVAAAYSDMGVQKALDEAFRPPMASGEKLTRSWLRDHVLPDQAKRRHLEGIIHPIVLQALENARSTAALSGANLFVAEVPLHYEIGGTVSADLVIVVAASRSVQVRRMMEKRGLDEQAVHAFLNAQWPIEAKAERADVVIWNDGDIPALEAQVLTLTNRLRDHE